MSPSKILVYFWLMDQTRVATFTRSVRSSYSLTCYCVTSSIVVVYGL